MNQPLSGLDGRYAPQCAELSPILSEFGLMKYRVLTEIKWLFFLKKYNILPEDIDLSGLDKLEESFDEKAFEIIKEIESTTRHDVKAVEYYLRQALPETAWPWIHFACTSEDINNLAYALQLRDARDVILNILKGSILKVLKEKALLWKATPMLSRTHGQPATPTTVGKEIAVFVSRLNSITNRYESGPIVGKLNGATGNYAAHTVAFPNVAWIDLSKEFVESLSLSWNPLTTQIENHDYQSELLDHMSRLGSVLSDLSTDMWGYISLGYFVQKLVAGEVGSSTMPHKVNPIDFENARGNFKLARGIGRTLSDELPISMWQRDLSDSTMQRNFGLVFGHFLVGLKSLVRGLGKLELNEAALLSDLNHNPEVLTEAIQTVLRKNGHADAYEQLKTLSRGKRITLEEIRTFVGELSVAEEDKKILLSLTPDTYIGKSAELVERFL